MRDSSWACAQTVHRFFRCLDENRLDDAVSLFADDGVWVRRGDPIKGHAALFKALNERPPGRLTRHVISNVIGDEDETCMVMRYDVTILSLDGPIVGVPPLPAPHTLLTCEDRLVETPHGWRFGSRSSRVLFASH